MDTRALLEKFVLSDLLDDSILAARPGDRTFPLRALMGHISATLESDSAFTFMAGINYYFRSSKTVEETLRLGFEVSREFYAFAHATELEAAVLDQASPLLVDLMNHKLDKVRFENTTAGAVFDSAVHERDELSDKTSPRIQRPLSFLARTTGNQMVRLKARVRT